MKVIRRQQDAGAGRHRSTDRPYDRHYALDRNAHVIGRQHVLRTRAHRGAERGAVEEQIEQRAKDDGRRDHREFVIGQHERADPHHTLAERGLDLEVVGAPDHADDGAQEIAESDRRHDDGKLRIAEDRTHHQPFRQHAEQRHRRDRRGKPDPVIEPEQANEGEGEEPAEHHQIALREVHDLGRLVDQDETERDQAVDAAERNATHQLLNEVQHLLPSPDALRFFRSPRCIQPSRSAISGAMKAAHCPGLIEPKAPILSTKRWLPQRARGEAVPSSFSCITCSLTPVVDRQRSQR